MVIYVVRHPETEYNKKGLTQGHDDSSLTEQGIKTAKKLGELLKNKDIVKIYSSDLGRCIQTSKLINKYLNVKISPRTELRERNYGDYNGKKGKLISDTFNISDPYFVLPNGESFNQMKERVLNFVNKVDKSTPILIVTHEGCLRAILSEILNFSFLSPKCDTRSNEVIILNKEKQKINILK